MNVLLFVVSFIEASSSAMISVCVQVNSGGAHPFLSTASTSSTLMPKMKRFSSPASSAISTLAPSMVPMVRAPFSMNFMFPVPEASVPAVEICSDRSAAGMTADGWRIRNETLVIVQQRCLQMVYQHVSVKKGYYLSKILVVK